MATKDVRKRPDAAEVVGKSSLLKACGETDFECREELALLRCQEQITWYEDQKDNHRKVYQRAQAAVIVLSALTPLLILWDTESADTQMLFGLGPPSPLIQALPAALASVLAAFMSSFGWRDEWSRFAYAAETLKSERVKFLTRATADYSGDDGRSVSNFVAAIEDISTTEVADWRKRIDALPAPEPVIKDREETTKTGSEEQTAEKEDSTQPEATTSDAKTT